MILIRAWCQGFHSEYECMFRAHKGDPVFWKCPPGNTAYHIAESLVPQTRLAEPTWS